MTTTATSAIARLRRADAQRVVVHATPEDVYDAIWTANLLTETRRATTDAVAARHFRLLWPVISPFAGMLRMQVVRAIKAEAEAR